MRPERYPGSMVKITSPFYRMACVCGHQEWRIFPAAVICPKCGAQMEQVYPEKGGEESEPPGEA